MRSLLIACLVAAGLLHWRFGGMWGAVAVVVVGMANEALKERHISRYTARGHTPATPERGNAPAHAEQFSWLALVMIVVGIAFARYALLPRFGIGGFVVGFAASLLIGKQVQTLEREYRRERRAR
jgi:hypothetical protein